MSFRIEKIYQNSGLNSNQILSELSETERKNLFIELLTNGIFGLCFSIYEEGQKPGVIVSEQQVRNRIDVIRPYTKWIRSFSCIEGNEHVPKIAKEYGMKTLVGAWLGNDEELNEKEIKNLINLAKQGYVDIAAVGNEVLYRKDLDEDQLLNYIQRVKKEIPNIPVGYVDAYYEFSIRPKITEACDIILANCYPFWESCPFEYSMNHLKSMYYQAKEAGNGKKVFITETGWPSQGQNLNVALPSYENARDYFINTQMWCVDENIPCFYFSSFDESWKTGPEGEVGAHWGIWDKNGKLKF
jgi:glucan 1,3-beta-glucosidase